MGIVTNSSGSNQISSRVASIGLFFALVYGLGSLDTSIVTHETWRTYFYLLLTPFVAILWFLHTKKCMIDLRLNRIWILSVLIPIAIVVFVFNKKLNILSWLAFAVAFILQLLIVLIQPRNKSTTTQANSSDGPRP